MTTLAMLIDQLFGPVPGGIGTYVRELVPALRAADPSLGVTLFHSRFDGEAPEEWIHDFPVVTLSAGIRRLYPSWTLFRRPPLPQPLAGQDVIHSPSPAAVPPVGGRQRLVVTIHDLAFIVHPELFPGQWRLMYRAAVARATRSADAILTVSRHTAEDLVRHTRVAPGRVHVVPLAAALPAVEAPVEETLSRLKVTRPYLLYVGTLEPRKNLVRLIRAYRRAAARGVPHMLVLAGPIGWHHEPILREASAPGPGHVVLTGPARAPADLDALYRGADAFAYPSLYEGFGLSVVEAMARGVPCLVSTSSSLPEVAGEAALLVDPRSVAGITEAIERLAGDRDLAARLSKAGLERVERYSWEETARRTLEVYRGIL